MKKLNNVIGIPEHLRDLGIKKDIMEELAQKAINDVGTFPKNPRKSSFDDIVNIYKNAF